MSDELIDGKMTTQQASRKYGISEPTLKAWRDKGYLPSNSIETPTGFVFLYSDEEMQKAIKLREERGRRVGQEKTTYMCAYCRKEFQRYTRHNPNAAYRFCSVDCRAAFGRQI